MMHRISILARFLFSLGLGYLGRFRLVLPFDSGSRSLSGSGTNTSNSIPLISNTVRDHPKGPPNEYIVPAQNEGISGCHWGEFNIRRIAQTQIEDRSPVFNGFTTLLQ